MIYKHIGLSNIISLRENKEKLQQIPLHTYQND